MDSATEKLCMDEISHFICDDNDKVSFDIAWSHEKASIVWCRGRDDWHHGISTNTIYFVYIIREGDLKTNIKQLECVVERQRDCSQQMADGIQKRSANCQRVLDSRHRLEWQLRHIGKYRFFSTIWVTHTTTFYWIPLPICFNQVVPERKLEALEKLCPKYCSSLYSLELASNAGRPLNVTNLVESKV